MLVLGIILLLLAGVALVAAMFGGRPADRPTGFDLGAIHVDASTFTVFLMGAATVVLLALGLWLVAAGLRRANRRRQDKKELNRLSRKLEAKEAAPPPGTTEAPRASTVSPQTPETPATPGTTATGTGASPPAAQDTASGTASGPLGDRPVTERDQPKP